MSFHIHAKGSPLLRSGILCPGNLLNVKPLLDFTVQSLKRIPVQIAYHTVVIHNHEFIIRKQYREKIVKLLLPGITRMFLPALLPYFYRGRCPVVSVCNVDAVNARKRFVDRSNIRILADDKHPVSHAVPRCEIIFRLSLLRLFHDTPDPVIRAVRQKDRSGLCVTDIHMADAVDLLLRAGILVLFDDAILIIIDGRAGCHSRLHSSVHGKFVEVITLFILRQKRAVLHPLPECIMRTLIHLVVVHIHRQRELCLRAVYAKERLRMPLHFLRSFLSVINIIREGSNLCCLPFLWSDAYKWSDFCHCSHTSLFYFPYF